MSGKLRFAAIGTVVAAAIVAGVVGAAYYAARQVQPFYRQALEIRPEVLKQGSRELENRATALYSDARRHGQWQALFTADQINGWLATQLESNDDRELPANFRDPRIAISKEALTLGFSTTSGGVETVITVEASVFLTEQGAVAIRLRSVRAGALPLPVMRLADELAAACQKLSLPVRWIHQDGEPVALVELHSDPASNKAQFFIDSIELGESELYVAGHTEIASRNHGNAPPIAGSGESDDSQVALDNFELRLTPKHKDGALQIARRNAREKSDEASESEASPAEGP